MRQQGRPARRAERPLKLCPWTHLEGTMPRKLPGYCRHPDRNRAYVRLDGRAIYLGEHGTAESRAEYERVIAEWLANGRRLPSRDPITVNGLVERYLAWVDGRYSSKEPENIRLAIVPLVELYGPTSA